MGARKIKDLRVRDFQDAEIFKTRNFETLTFWLGGSKQDGPNQFHAGESRANQPGFVASGAAGDFASARPAKGRAAQETLDRLQASQSHLGGLSFWEKLGNVPLFAKTWRKTWKHGETWGETWGQTAETWGQTGRTPIISSPSGNRKGNAEPSLYLHLIYDVIPDAGVAAA